MGFGFNGIPSAEVTISGGTAIDYSGLKRQYYDGTGTSANLAVPEGKKWIIVGTGLHSNALEGFIIATIGTGAKIYLSCNWASPEYLNQVASLPLLLEEGDYIQIDNDGMFSYYEIDA